MEIVSKIIAHTEIELDVTMRFNIRISFWVVEDGCINDHYDAVMTSKNEGIFSGHAGNRKKAGFCLL